jgi:hypothetical protein
MSKAVRNDWDFSDDVFASQSTKNFLKKHYGYVSIRKATEEEDIHNNIDYYINDIPIQWRTQRFENRRYSVKDYHATFRYSRENSKFEERQTSEILKIIRNKNNGLPYPKHHIWCLADKNFNIVKGIIIDVDKFLSDYDNRQYEFKYKLNNNKTQKVDPSITTGRIILIRYNGDNSSEFISLNEKYLLPNTILFKYINS